MAAVRTASPPVVRTTYSASTLRRARYSWNPVSVSPRSRGTTMKMRYRRPAPPDARAASGVSARPTAEAAKASDSRRFVARRPDPPRGGRGQRTPGSRQGTDQTGRAEWPERGWESDYIVVVAARITQNQKR